jgi:hypothetical protein
MSNGNSGPAFTLRDIQDLLRNELGPVRARVDNLDGSLDALRRQMAQEISRLENEMNELAKLIVKAIDRQTEMVVHGLDRQTDSVTGGIDRQTIAVVGGVAAVARKPALKSAPEPAPSSRWRREMPDCSKRFMGGSSPRSSGAPRGRL